MIKQKLMKTLLALVFTLAFAGTATAANNIYYTASDDPNNSPDSTQGVNVWTVNANTGGSYYHTGVAGSGPASHWAIWGNGNHNTTTATHTFAGGALTDGQTVSIGYAHGGNIDNGYTVGIRLLDAAGTVQAEFSFLGGSTFQQYDTGSGVFTQNTGKSYDSFDLFTLSYTIGTGGTNYTASAGPGVNSWGGSGSWSGTVTNPIAQIQVFTVGGWNSDQLFNNLQITTANVCPAIFLGLSPTPLLKNAASSNNIIADGGVAPYSYAVIGGSLPPGLSLSSAGALTGTPTNAALSTFAVLATDANGCTGTNAFNLRVYATGADHSGNYSSWSGNGGTGFGSWSFYIDNHGSGFTGEEKTTSGDANIHVADGSAWKLYAIDFSSAVQQEEAIAYRTFSSPLQVSNDLFSVSMEIENGNAGIGNPGQMGFALRNGNTTGSGNQTTGARLAVYLAGGSNNVVVLDAAGPHESTVPGGLGTAYDFTARLTSGSTYELTITRYTNGAGATAAPVVMTGTLAGSGVINSLALFNTKNSVESDNRNSDAYFNRLAYNSANFVCPTITLGNLGNGLVGGSYNFPISAAGGLAPYNFTVGSGSLPPGLTLSSSGVLSGTPTTAGTNTFTVVVTDGNNCTGSRTYALQVYGSGGDNAGNYGSWTNGANAGSGFSAWELYSSIHGGVSTYAGYEKTTAAPNLQSPDGSVLKLYAVSFGSNPWEESEAYRKFNVPLSVAGDVFGVSFQHGLVGSPGQVGFALRNGDFSGSGGFDGRARLQFYFSGGGTNLAVEDASGAREIPNLPFTYFGWDVVVRLTGPDTYSASITRFNGVGTADSPVTVTGNLAGGGPIDSLALFNWNYASANAVNNDAFFNNIGYTSTTTVITNDVTFNVDMSVQILAGNFNPASQTVEVHGTFSDWLGVTLTNNPSLPGNAANVYSGVVPIRGALNSGESYWFDYYDNASFTKESETPKVSTLDSGPTHYDRFLLLPNVAATNLPVVLFSDLNTNDYLPAATAVTFSVNMNGAVTTAGYVFGTSPSDTVWINGAFIPWYPWYTPADPSGTAGPAQYQMFESATPGVYTNTIIIPTGSALVLNYKYGIGIGTNSPADGGPRDNEAAFNQNHNRVIRSTATGGYVLPLDKFGNQYVEPFFSVQAKVDGQLSVGAPAGGTVPVKWLGRPGAHLQGTTNLTGPWADYPNTDGAHWTSGVNTTNGLLSVTNMPATGNNYFRLVKP